MDILNLNKIKITFILTVFSFISCQKIAKKESTINIITLKGYNLSKVKKIKFYTVSNDKTLDSIKIDKILKFTVPNIDGFGNIDMYLNKFILPNEKYKLVINDTNKYYINDLKMNCGEYMVGMRKDTMCFLNSYKINNHLIDSLSSTRLEIYSNYSQK